MVLPGGLGSIFGFLTFLLFVYLPLLSVFALGILKFYRHIEGPVRLMWYFFTLLGFSILYYLLLAINGSLPIQIEPVEFLLLFGLYMTIAVPILSVIVFLYKQYLKKIRIGFSALTFVALTTFYILTIDKPYKYSDDAAASVIEHLGLTPVAHSKFLKNYRAFVIEKDTIAGVYSNVYSESDEVRVFYKDIKSNDNFKSHRNRFLPPSISVVKAFNNGQIYGKLFPDNSPIQMMDINGEAYRLDMDYANDIFPYDDIIDFYQDKMIITSQRAILIVNEADYKLIWKHKMGDAFYASSFIYENLLIFLESAGPSKFSTIYAVDLDVSEIKWQKRFPKIYTIDQDKKGSFAANGGDTTYFVEVATGEIFAKHNFYVHRAYASIDGEVAIGQSSNETISYNYKTDSVLWTSSHPIYFIYKDKIVGFNDEAYIISNKTTGKLEKTFPFDGNRRDFYLKGDYILVDTILYK